MAFPCWWIFPKVIGYFMCILPGLWFMHLRFATYVIIGILCFSWALYRFECYQSQKILLPYHCVFVKGYITSILKENQLYKRFLFQSNSTFNTLKGKRLILSAFKNHKEFQVGDEWQLEVNLKPPHSLSNPKGINGQLNFYLQGVYGIGYVKDSLHNQRLKQNVYGSSLSRFRQKVENTINKISLLASDSDKVAILKALSIGNRHLSAQAWKVFQLTGTSHLLAISGLHVSLIASIVYYGMRKVFASFHQVTAYFPAYKASAVCSIVAVLAYGIISGFSLPTQRASIMVFVLMLEKLINRYSPFYWRLLLALVFILAVQPLSILTHSFWLSFIAVFCIVYFFNGYPYRQRLSKNWLDRLIQWGQIQGVIFLALLPVSLLFFGQISLWCFLANSLAIPWVCFVVLPILLIAMLVLPYSIVLSTYFFKLGIIVLEPLWLFLNWLAGFDWAIWHHVVSRIWVVCVAYVGILWLLSRKFLKFRFLGILAFIPLIFFAAPVLKTRDFRLILFDVGQGLASLIQTKHHLLIYDTGPRFLTGFNAGTHVILPYLSYMHITTVDKLIISHNDIDHAGGADILLKSLRIDDLLASGTNAFKLYFPKRCYSGQQWQWDGVNFEVLWPPKTLKYLKNNSSCVLKVYNGKSSVLLTGDIEVKAEQALVNQSWALLKSAILVVPHHGSATSSSYRFLKAVKPQYALFSTGYLNRFHFPAKKIWRRYKKLQAHRINTAISGAIQMEVKANGQIHVHLEKNKNIF